MVGLAGIEPATPTFAVLGQSSVPAEVDDEQDNPTFRDCSRLYEGIRKAVLTAHPWNFATKRMPAAASNSGDGEYMTVIPGDCLQVLRLEDASGEEIPRNRAGRMLYTQEEPKRIVYIVNDEEPDGWDPWARKALVHRLAADFARVVKGSMQERDLQEGYYEKCLGEAKRVNSQEGYAHVRRTYADKVILGEAD